VQRVRTHEAAIRDRGFELRTAAAVHEASGAVAGLTEMELRPDRDDVAFQLDTAVVPEYRGHGLGRFIEAEMMRWLLTVRPHTEMVTTNTDAGNVHMIRVNHQLGHITVDAICDVEASIETLERNTANLVQ
jgi:mycothiol synthase